MKVFVISPFSKLMYKKGGGTPTKYNLIKGFTDAGHEVHMICPSDNAPTNPIKELQIHRFKLPFNNFRSDMRALNLVHIKVLYFLFIFLATCRALAIARKIGPDVVYGFGCSGAVAAYIIGKMEGIPNITRLFGTMRLYEFIHRPFQLLIRFDEVLAIKTPCGYLVITNDGTKGDVVARSLGVPFERIKFWMNGVDDMLIPNFNVEEFKKSIGIPEHKKVILVVSRLTKWKRVDRVINAAPSIVSQYKDAMFLIVGDGPEKNNLEKLTHELNIEKHVKFTGMVPHSEVKKYLNCASIFVSMHDTTNLVNPVLEAMTCGRCIVTLDVGGTSEVIKNNWNGILLDVNDVGELPNVIVRLLNDKKLREKLSKNARRYALDLFQTWGERYGMEVRLIEEIAEGDSQNGRG